jgi:hypothetical protein
MWPFKGKGKSEKQVKKEEQAKTKNETKTKENKKDKKETVRRNSMHFGAKTVPFCVRGNRFCF